MDYQIYTKREILNSGINSKMTSKAFTLFFEFRHLKFGVKYEPWYSKHVIGLAHFDFYAMTRGFESFTKTGYRSLWIQNPEKLASYAEVKSYFLEALKEIINLEEPAEPIQLGLF
ncbi:MAG TPA: hypothetical protein ENK82_08060 [Campylobacterales bacterium]|nr:hypothetical protein [Campylobacterales bacterium]